MLNIEILVVPDCPHADHAYRSCQRATTGMPDVSIIVTEICDDVAAQRSGMRGSPTILINGDNPFDDPDSATSCACRIGPDAIPTEHDIAEVARAANRT